jgi:triosephosphate isomerase (TIM)
MPPRPLVAGNWKMNGLRASLAELAAIRDRVAAGEAGNAELLVCPPATLVGLAVETAKGLVSVGGQDCAADPAGPHTGDISAEMLADLGATYVIVGHSERRADHGETDSVVRKKALAARRAGLTAILCLGETQDDRVEGRTLDIVGRQFEISVPQDGATAANLVIAYEPVWAIGTGLTPTVADVAEVHSFIRGALVKRFGAEGKGMRVLYGGSVKPSNAAELLGITDVDGALVGGASLKADDFLGIARVYS